MISDAPVLFDVCFDPLSFFEGQGLGKVDPESVLEFLCKPGTDSSAVAVATRYREIDQTGLRLSAAPADQQILNKLVWPLREAKAAYMVGGYLGTVSLCAMVAEMVAILIFDLAKVRLDDREMTPADQDALFGSRFERLDQERRVRVLVACGLIDPKRRAAFDAIRLARNRYLTRWSEDPDDLAEMSRSAFDAALKLVVSVIGREVKDGAMVLNPRLVEYLREIDALRHREDATKTPK